MGGCTFILNGGGVKWINPESKEAPQDKSTVEEIYENTKIPDEMLAGKYANMVAVTQNNGDFCLDFVLSLFPRSVVTARVFISIYHATELMNALKSMKL
jgi:hypothetical protein